MDPLVVCALPIAVVRSSTEMIAMRWCIPAPLFLDPYPESSRIQQFIYSRRCNRGKEGSKVRASDPKAQTWRARPLILGLDMKMLKKVYNVPDHVGKRNCP